MHMLQYYRISSIYSTFTSFKLQMKRHFFMKAHSKDCLL